VSALDRPDQTPNDTPDVTVGQTPESTDEYDAFISYSHEGDLDLAREVQQGLHRLARPWYGRRALHVFRDATGLGVSPDLWESICTALDSSRYFILMASPASARSEWVGRELSRWLDARRPEHILIVLSDGAIEWLDDRADFDWDVSDSLHPVLRGVFRSEPLYLDLRWARSMPDLSIRDPRFRGQIAELAAPIHGRAPDDLQGEDLRQQQKVRRATRGAISVLVALLVVALVMSGIAFQQRGEARHAAAVAQARALSAEVLNQQATGRNGLAQLLAVESDRVNSGLPSQAALLHALEAPPGLQRDVEMRSGSVGNTAFSADGSLLAADDGSRIRVLHVDSGNELTTHMSYASSQFVGSLHFADRSRLLAAPELTETHSRLLVWRVGSSAHPLEVAAPPNVDAGSLATSDDAPMLAAVDSESTYSIDVWDATSGQLVSSVATGAQFESEASTRIALSPNGEVAAMARILPVSDGAKQYVEVVSAWDVRQGTALFECSAPVGGVYDGYYTMYPDVPQLLDVTVDDAGRSIEARASGGTRAILASCRAGTAALAVDTINVPTVRTAPVEGISRDDTKIATRDSVTGAVHVYGRPAHDDDAPVEVRPSVIEPPFAAYEGVAVDFSPDSRYLTLPNSAIDELQVWRAGPGADSLSRPVRIPKGDRLLDVAPGARYLLVQSPSGEQRVLDRRTGNQVGTRIVPSPKRSDACQITPDVSFNGRGDHLAVEEYDGNCDPRALALWDLSRAQRREVTIPARCDWSGSFAMSDDARVLVVGCEQSATNARAKSRVARIDISQHRSRLLSIDPIDINPDQIVVNRDGSAVVVGETDHARAAYQALELGRRHLVRGPVDPANGNFIGTAAFSPDGHTFVTGFSDGRVRLWANARDRQPSSDLTTTGSAGAESIAFSPDGARLVIGDDSGEVRLWDVPTRTLVGAVTQRAAAVDAVTFVDEAHVVAASKAHTYDSAESPPGSASTLSFDTRRLRAAACNVVRRDLSRAERAKFSISDRGDVCGP
jgi:WD40 repeat protein